MAARRAAPLIVGVAGSSTLLASDIPALLGRTRQLFALDDDQLAELRPGTLRVTTFDGDQVEPTALSVDWDLEAAQKGGYDDFMTKEIHEQPPAVADTLLDRRGPTAASASTSCASTTTTFARWRRSSSWPAAAATTPPWWPSTPSSTGPGCPPRSTSPASSATGTRCSTTARWPSA